MKRMASSRDSESKEDEDFLNLIADFDGMWFNHIHPDIKLRTRKALYPAHKCVLSARSPVFANLLANHTGECLDIVDLDNDFIADMLMYIYSGFVGELNWNKALGLYAVAVEYKLLTLKHVSSTYLKKHLSLDNANTTCMIATLLGDDLKDYVQEFISKSRPSWRNSVRNWVQIFRRGNSASSDREPSSDPISSLNEEQSAAVKNALIEDFKAMVEFSLHSDITLKTSGREYPAHKCVLITRSPVFKTLLSNHSSDSLEIGDLDDDTVCRMFRYIYTGQVEELGMDSAIALYAAANKYGFPLLKRKCLSYLTEHMRPSNAHETLQLLQLHPDKELENFISALIKTKNKDYNPQALTQLMQDKL